MNLLHTFLIIGHIVGVAIGAGGATMSDVLFVTSIADNRIDRSELRLLKIASKVVVIGLLLLTVTGLGFLLTGSPTSPRFWAKMTIVLIAAVNGFVMHRLLFPLFERCARERTAIGSAEFTRYTPLLVVAGPVSAISWYAAIVLGAWRSLTLTYWQYITVYGFLVTVSIGLSAFALDYVMANPEVVTRFVPRRWVAAFYSAETPRLQPAVLVEVTERD